jgi:hypothetical protein
MNDEANVIEPRRGPRTRAECHTAAAAQCLADRILQFWKDKGAVGVKVWIEPIEVGGKDGQLFGIRSNLKNGLPGMTNKDLVA